MDPEIKVEFHITGTKITPDEITNFLGISPTDTWNLGDSIQGTKLKRKHNGWCYSIGVQENTLDVVDYIVPLINFLLPKSELIIKVCQEHGLFSEIACSIYVANQTPVLHLDTEVMSNLVRMKTHLDFDLILTE